MTAPEHVVLVNQDDQEIGLCEKLEAHRNGGKLHRAFSVFLQDGRGNQLLQRRAVGKYHFGGLWTNACCSHPRSRETPLDAAHRRLYEELRIRIDRLDHLGSFIYRAVDPASGLTEHEIDHVVSGRFDGAADPNPAEVAECRWISATDLNRELGDDPSRFTPWFPIALEHARRLRPDLGL